MRNVFYKSTALFLLAFTQSSLYAMAETPLSNGNTVSVMPLQASEDGDNSSSSDEEVVPVSLPYSVEFTEEPADWTTIDNSTTAGTTWKLSSYTCFDDGYRMGMGMVSDYGGGPDDYLVSPAFQFSADKTYTLGLSYTTYATGGNLEIGYLTDKNDASTFTKFADGKKDGNKYFKDDKIDFTVPADGIYNLAFRITSKNSYAYVYLFDVAVSEKAEEVVPVALPYSVEFTEEPTDWTTIDNSTTAGTTWKLSSYTCFDDGYRMGMGMVSDYGGGPDDYLVSPAFQFSADKTYTLGLSYTTYATGGNLEIGYLTDKNDASTFTKFADGKKDGNKYFKDDKIDFTVPADGIYNLAFRITSKNSYAYVYLFDVAVSEKTTTGINGLAEVLKGNVVNISSVDGKSVGKDVSSLASGCYIITVKSADGKCKSVTINK